MLHRFPLALLIVALALLPGLRRPQGVAVSARAIGALQPRLSPDGKTIVFMYQGAIWRMGSEGGEMRRLTSGAGYDTDPGWSPDGKRIAYFGGSEFRIIDAESGAAIALPAKLSGSGEVYFHPDGKRVVGNFGGGAPLSWADLETGRVQPVLQSSRRLNVFALSPDGSRIAYATTQDVLGEQGGHNGPQGDIWIISAEGGESKRLAQFRSRVYDLWWGRDGLVLASDLGGAHNDLWTMSLDDPSHAHKITSGQADEDAASVSADGRWLVYTDNREGPTAIVRRELSTGSERMVPITRMDFGAPTGTLKIRVSETARVSVRQANGKYFAPVGALYRMLGNVEHFYADKEAEIVVPAGSYQIRAYRGLEYLETKADAEVAAGGVASVQLDLKRWTDPPSRGWWGGESHVHANYGYGQWYNTPSTMRLQVEGEGLNLANMVVANSDTDGIFDREFFRGAPDPVSTARHILYWNQEFRATLWGHMTLYNLKHLVEPIMTGFKDTTNPWDVPTNSDIADHTHLQGGHVNYTHPAQNAKDPFATAYAAKSIPVDVALGKIDSLDINAGYDATVPLWHRMLNCGLRLPASAGTDVFLNRVRSGLPGGSRAYIKLDGPFSYDAWVKGLKAGRSFVTNGPMLEFTAGGKALGETLVLAGPGEVSVKGSAEASIPLSRVDVVHNGVVVANFPAAADQKSLSVDASVKVERSGWLGLRAFGPGTIQAHTSPIYVDVAGKRPTSKADAQYFLEWIDRLEAKFKERDRAPSPDLRAHVERQLNAARDVYRKAAGE